MKKRKKTTKEIIKWFKNSNVCWNEYKFENNKAYEKNTYSFPHDWEEISEREVRKWYNYFKNSNGKQSCNKKRQKVEKTRNRAQTRQLIHRGDFDNFHGTNDRVYKDDNYWD